jgi:NCAIR mutase (PurE)-related protein
MNRNALETLLNAVAAGEMTPHQAVERLRGFPAETMEEATLDRHRGLRCGFPEVIYGEGKSVEQVRTIAARIVEHGDPLLATRLRSEALDALAADHPGGKRVDDARLFYLPGGDSPPPAGAVAVVSAGTSDQAVAEEAAWTATALGAPVTRLRDVGVAGLHRLLQHGDTLRTVAAVVVVAGMEGALPSVVGGLTDRPVIAVPTSVGYGAHFGGLAPLLAMLNSCAAGVTVVNIDNGFAAGYSAALIARLAAQGVVPDAARGSGADTP